MNKILFGIYITVASTLVWSQSSRGLPPLPPPPNPASLSGYGSPAFDMLLNNIKSARSPEPTKDSLILENNIKSARSAEPMQDSLSLESIEDSLISGPGNTKAKKPSVAYDSQPRSLQMPESFESNIQGLQFIQKTPSQ
jgi:hypothetical protein